MRRLRRTERLLLDLLVAVCLGSCSETARPIVEPFLVGKWEAASELGTVGWVKGNQVVVLVLYDDGAAALNDRKGTWVLGDASRASVRIEIPQRYEGRTYELVLQNEQQQPLWGTMLYEGKVLRFEQTEHGGIIGATGQFLEHAKVTRDRAEKESAQAALHKSGWKRRSAIFWHCLRYGASYGVSCDGVLPFLSSYAAAQEELFSAGFCSELS
jgi:hypothetical protein